MSMHTVHRQNTYIATAIKVSSWLGQKATESGVLSKVMVFIHLPVDTSHNLRVLSPDPSKLTIMHNILINAHSLTR